MLEPLFFPEGAVRKAGRIASASSVRECYNAIRYLLKTVCQWRMLPVEFPPLSTVHDAFTRWTSDVLWPRINEALHAALRLKLKKNTVPSAAIIDSQSVKCADTVGTGSSATAALCHGLEQGDRRAVLMLKLRAGFEKPLLLPRVLLLAHLHHVA